MKRIIKSRWRLAFGLGIGGGVDVVENVPVGRLVAITEGIPHAAIGPPPSEPQPAVPPIASHAR